MKTYVVGTHLNCLIEMVQMSTHNICFHWKIRKIILQLSAIYSSYLVYWQVKQCPNKTYSLQILNCTAPGQDWFYFVQNSFVLLYKIKSSLVAVDHHHLTEIRNLNFMYHTHRRSLSTT